MRRCVLLFLLASLPCCAQFTFSAQGQFTVQGQFQLPGSPVPAPIASPIKFGIHVHNPTQLLPSVPYDAARIWGTGCQWNTIETAAGVFNWSCIDQWIAIADAANVDLLFTFGQLPKFLSTISTDPGPFPVATNGIAITCVSGSCSATVTTLQRMNAALSDTLVIAGDDGSCPESLVATGGATAVNNQTDYPWTYSFPIASGNTSSTGCGGSAITVQDTSVATTFCNGTGSPPSGQGGGCYSPADINVDGTGNDCEFKINSGACAGPAHFLLAFLNHLASADPNHRLKYMEMWNEPQGRGFFNGSIAQMARMQKDAHTLIQSGAESYIVLTSPAPSGGLTSPAAYLALYCADPSSPMQYADQIDVHTYNFPANSNPPNPADAQTIASNVKAALSSCPFAGGKDLVASEGGWGQGQWAGLSTNINLNTGTAAAADKPAWAFLSYLFHYAAGYKRFYWFALDQQCNSGLECTGPPTTQAAAISYAMAHDLFTGSTLAQTPTKDASNTWTAKLTKGNGYTGLVVFNLNLTTAGTYTIPANMYAQQRDLAGNVTPITSGQTSVPLNYDPVILENIPPPLDFTDTILNPGTSGVAYFSTIHAACALPCIAPATFREITQPPVFSGVNGFSFNVSTGLVGGLPSSAGTFCSVFGIQDSTGLTATRKLCATISAPGAVKITNPPPPGGTQGQTYSPPSGFQFTASGGIPGYTWTVASGSLPTGLTLSAGGMLSGTPSAAGTFTFAVQVCDSEIVPQCVTSSPSYTVVIQSSGTIGGADNRYCGAGDTPNFSSSGTTDGPAVLPTACINTALANTPAPGSTVTVASDCSDLQTKLTALTAGQKLVIPRLNNCSTASGYTVPAVSGRDASHWTWIETDATGDSNFPAEGVRAIPCQIGLSSLPGRPAFSCSSTAVLMPTVKCTGVNCAVFRFAAGASFVRFIGLNITTNGQEVNHSLVDLAGGTAPLPDHIILDRTINHGADNDAFSPTAEVKVGLSTSGSTHVAVIDSYWYNFQCDGGSCVDAQTFNGGLGSVVGSAFKFVNNFMEASGEACGIFGGGGATVTPTDLEFRRNHCFHPLTWFLAKGGSGAHPEIKNLGEQKNVIRALYEGNLYENNWAGWQGDQPGTAVLLTPKNQSGACPNCIVTDVTFRYNIVRHAENGMGITSDLSDSGAASLGVHRISVHDVIFDDLNAQNWNNANSPCCNGGFAFKITSGQTTASTWPSDIQINHITGLQIGFNNGALTGWNVTIPTNPAYFPNITIENSVGAEPMGLLVGGGATYIAGGALGGFNIAGCPLSNGQNCTYVFTKNLLLQGMWTGEKINDPLPVSNVTCGTGGESCEPTTAGYGTYFANANMQLTGNNTLISPNCSTAPGDCHLAVGSPYKNAGTDGSDLGANIDLVNTFTQGVN